MTLRVHLNEKEATTPPVRSKQDYATSAQQAHMGINHRWSSITARASSAENSRIIIDDHTLRGINRTEEPVNVWGTLPYDHKSCETSFFLREGGGGGGGGGERNQRFLFFQIMRNKTLKFGNFHLFFFYFFFLLLSFFFQLFFFSSVMSVDSRCCCHHFTPLFFFLFLCVCNPIVCIA